MTRKIPSEKNTAKMNTTKVISKSASKPTAKSSIKPTAKSASKPVKKSNTTEEKKLTNRVNNSPFDTLTLPNLRAVVRKTTRRKEFHWAVFGISLAGFVILFFVGFFVIKYLLNHYKVDTIYVEGNIHYSNEEIIDMVMEGPLGYNSIFLGVKYRNKSIDDVPFVQQMDVEVVNPTTIRINVYEKAIAGYFEHLGRYVYFDKDGIVVETSDQPTKGTPLVTGLDFDYVVMYEPLPVEKREIFEDILDITQLLNKYEIAADRIYFDRDGRKTLYFDDARVSLGTNDNIDEKILKLKYILPSLEGRKGILRMDNYSDTVTNITFEEDKQTQDKTSGENG